MFDTINTLYPDYCTTTKLDELRANEYSYLDQQDHIYLDYTGSGLAANSQHRHHQERLTKNVYGNPHSTNPTSLAASEAINQTRDRILSYFNAPASEYAVVFTPNATGAARLVAEAYPFRPRSRFVLTEDNHNSVQGIREFARAGGAKTVYIPLQKSDLRIDDKDVIAALTPKTSRRRFMTWCSQDRRTTAEPNGLFAYPAQSNFSGVQHPLSWIDVAQKRGYHVLLDAAAYLPTSQLDLSQVKPDYILVSWYKLFGYPTGLGCLIARRDALEYLRPRRPWFSGGTVQVVLVSHPWHLTASRIEEVFEDGTLNFLSIPDIHFGLDWISQIGIPVISTRVRCLTGWFLTRLLSLRHSNGMPMARVYGPTDMTMRGGTVAFNLIDISGRLVDERLVEMEATVAKISLRTGCFCNPGVGEKITEGDFKHGLNKISSKRRSWSSEEMKKLTGATTLGAARVSFGLASNVDDVNKFISFLEKVFKDRETSGIELEPRNRC
ncbi:uncharacterized protein CTHT_0050760 [Thermochaetoides thermophila DSM 1495]|uniref:Aminotransferase class V domain-containing protein n=1 Tax=Chaetomium thermophilum (strain DSM 1495 / CBS 144.50 / IMI 039719) TaxID=759272 RepID=G0SD44_CHATD|nr:hypothetical protein CTHT_0050760 [Thermochaetoides thermophila DSM 1495]EGS18474.1 hypothetical protein CTHT_0050760 [Thermochaetoides thermophila DSM 1495]